MNLIVIKLLKNRLNNMKDIKIVYGKDWMKLYYFTTFILLEIKYYYLY